VPYFPKKPLDGAAEHVTAGARLRQHGCFGDVDDLAAEAFARAIRHGKRESHARARVLLFGFAEDDLADLRSHLRQAGVKTTATVPNVRRLPDFANMQQAFSHVFINLDSYGTVSAGVDALLAFRAAAPGFVVILCSAEVSADDFGSERSAICEATLRLPVSAGALQQALVLGIMEPNVAQS
jgi:hypothetical protein